MEQKWECYYCEKGFVTALPAPCPECKTELRKPLDQLTDDEAKVALAKKMVMGSPPPSYSLAS